MLAIVAGNDADPWERTEATAAIFELDRARRPEMIEMLGGVAADSTITADQRLHAAESLLRAGPEAAGRACELLVELANLPSASHVDRRQAANLLQGVAGRPFVAGLKVLRGLAGNEAASPVDRAVAHDLLAVRDYQHRSVAVDALREVVADPTTVIGDRLTAATCLAGYGGEHRETTATTLRRLAAPVLDAVAGLTNSRNEFESLALFESLMALATLTVLEPGSALTVARRLRAAVADPALNADQRRRTAEALAETGPENRARALKVLTELVVDRVSTPSERLASALTLRKVTGAKQRNIDF